MMADEAKRVELKCSICDRMLGTFPAAHLNAMNAVGLHPWQLASSFARALQDPVVKAWRGEDVNRVEA